MSKLYVTGGRQRVKLLKTEEEWNLYEKALVLKVDTEAQTVESCLEYESPLDVCAADGNPSFLFKTGTLRGNIFYLCTSTEVLLYTVPAFKQIGYVSLPCFNDLHHVTPTKEGHLLVANTGLDMVVEFTGEGKVLREWSVLGEDPWDRFSRDVDYRRVATTKPHRSHPNHVLELEGDIWVTRGQQGDAVCLTQPERQVKLSSVGVHDGHLYNRRAYFTSVDGTIVVVDLLSSRVLETVDLKTFPSDNRSLLGWCRGLWMESPTAAWVGFTRIRKTKFKENVNWVKHIFHDTEKPTRIALYDLATERHMCDIDLEKHGLNVLFGIHPAI